MHQRVLGVDIGGSGMKAAIVDIEAGMLDTPRKRFKTPKPATPDLMATVFADLKKHFEYEGPIGCAFPGVAKDRTTVMTAANLDPSWEGVDAASLFGTSDSPVTLINDADAAGLAEIHHGAGHGVTGTVLLITIGTGLGSALFIDGKLVPNTELGHIELNGLDAETRASSRVIDDFGLSFEQWAPRMQEYLRHLEHLFWPELFILGGGISKNFDEWAPLIDVRTPTVPAELRNNAGIVGAAMAAVTTGRS